MGKYFNPVDELPNVGKKIYGSSWDNLKRQVPSNSYLIGLFDRIVLKVAPYLHSENEFNAFNSQYMNGMFISRDFYIISQSDFEKYVQ